MGEDSPTSENKSDAERRENGQPGWLDHRGNPGGHSDNERISRIVAAERFYRRDRGEDAEKRLKRFQLKAAKDGEIKIEIDQREQTGGKRRVLADIPPDR